MNNIRKIFEEIKKHVLKENPPVLLKDNILDNPFKKFIAIYLSPRTKDSILINVCKNLFKKINSFEDIINIDINELEEILKPLGMYKIKARNLKKVSKEIVEKYNGKIPDNFEELIKLTGIGKKIAKIILAEFFNKPYVAVDTHVHRISNRLGIVDTKSIEETDEILEKILPNDIKLEYNKILVGFGQTICLPKKPLCYKCPVKSYCKKNEKKRNIGNTRKPKH